jgi:hypothetical protein
LNLTVGCQQLGHELSGCTPSLQVLTQAHAHAANSKPQQQWWLHMQQQAVDRVNKHVLLPKNSWAVQLASVAAGL